MTRNRITTRLSSIPCSLNSSLQSWDSACTIVWKILCQMCVECSGIPDTFTNRYFLTITYINKKVLVRDSKRGTARVVACPRGAVGACLVWRGPPYPVSEVPPSHQRLGTGPGIHPPSDRNRTRRYTPVDRHTPVKTYGEWEKVILALKHALFLVLASGRDLRIVCNPAKMRLRGGLLRRQTQINFPIHGFLR